MKLEIYTDGSCNPVYQAGSWAALLIVGEEKITISGLALGTTHHRMELTAVIKSIEFAKNNTYPYKEIIVYTDSQYVIGITEKIEKIRESNFQTKRGVPIRNDDLVRAFIDLIQLLSITFYKVKAHAKTQDSQGFNRLVDKLSRRILREFVEKK